VRASLRADIALALGAFVILSPASADASGKRGVLAGAVPSAVTGSVTAGRCDVNGDGLDDALTADNRRPTNTSYVVFGQWGLLRTVDLAEQYRGFKIVGTQGSPTAAISCAGDVNRDGYDDVLVGSWLESPNHRAQAGTVYVVFGKRDGADVDVRDLGHRGFRIDGERARHRIGVEEVSRAGDVNRDGYDDVIIGANGADDKGASTGAAYIVFGKRDTAAVDLAAVALGNGGYKVIGAQAGDRAGFTVAWAGDVNRDRVPDQLVGAYTAARNGQSTVGEAYVVFGKKRDTSPIDLATLGDGGITILGAGASERLGMAVNRARDVNRDGYDDVVVGADGGSGDRPGRAFVIFGRARGGVVDTAALEDNGYTIEGAAPGENAGFSVDSLPDMNGDRRPEVIVGAYDSPPAGRVYVVFGRKRASTVSLAKMTRWEGFAIEGTAADDRFGRSVSDLGCFSSRWFPAIAIGADAADPLARDRAGQVELIPYLSRDPECSRRGGHDRRHRADRRAR
jgi:hypothetical protein